MAREIRTDPAQSTGLRSKKNWGHGRDFFLDFYLYRTFRRGHRIMVQVQSSWFPLTDRNPQTFVNIPDAKASDFVKATERVYHTKEQPSGIEVEVVPRAAMTQK